jgi:hypothetical protein
MSGFQPVQTPPPQAAGVRWPLVIGGVLLGLLVIAVIWLLLPAGGPPPAPSPTQPPTMTPSPAPTSSPTPSPPPASAPPASPASPSTTPGPTASGGGVLDPDIAALIDAVVADVPRIRQLDRLRDVPYELITRQEFQASIDELIAEDLPPERLALEQRVLTRLGLLPAGMDLGQALEDLYGSQVAAFYRPDTGRFYLIERDQPFGAVDKVTVAHEYTHALQDQHFDLEGSRITDPAEGDAVLGQLAVIEGDATLVMTRWMLDNLSFAELLEISTQSAAPADQAILERMPPILRRQLLFPYVDGLVFVSELESSGGWSAVDDALSAPPPTTEQVLHPAKYRAGEGAMRLDLEDMSSVLGAGWHDVYQQTMGELNTQVWTAGGEASPGESLGLPVPPPHAQAAAGWNGDRLVMYEDGGEGWALAWRTAWDTQADADEFAERANQLRSTLAGESRIVVSEMDSEPDEIVILAAHDGSTLATFATSQGF